MIGVYPNCMLGALGIFKFKLSLSVGYPGEFYCFTYNRTYCGLVFFGQAIDQPRRHTDKHYEVARLHVGHQD